MMFRLGVRSHAEVNEDLRISPILAWIEAKAANVIALLMVVDVSTIQTSKFSREKDALNGTLKNSEVSIDTRTQIKQQQQHHVLGTKKPLTFIN